MHYELQSFNLTVTVNLYVNILENLNILGSYNIFQIATHHLIKLIILIGRKYFSNYVAQSNY